MLWTLFGALGGLCFAFAAVPAAFRCFMTGKPSGTPPSTAWAIVIGCISLYVYLTGLHGFDPLLSILYGLETGSWMIVLFYHYRSRPYGP